MEQGYAVIVDNGGGPNLIYHDEIGKLYTFPTTYRKYLLPGTKVIYARSGKKSDDDKLERMMDDAHYFGMAEIGPVVPTNMNNLRATIINYQKFTYPVPFNNNGDHFETAEGMFWRNGVRPISADVYNKIVSSSQFAPIIIKSSCSDRGKRSTRSLNVALNSKTFADEQFEIVTAKDGYYLSSLSDGIYYKLTGKKGLSLSSGIIKVLQSGSNRNHYLIRHEYQNITVDVGKIDLEMNAVNFDNSKLFDGSIKLKA